jgi:hypothetical protein
VEGLDLLGAGDAFSNQYITFRVKYIDREKLKLALGGSTGSVASSALSIVDTAPKAFIDLMTPIIRDKAKDYGVDTEIMVSNVPPSKGGRAISEFWPGVLAGFGVTAVGVLLYKGIAHLAGKR